MTVTAATPIAGPHIADGVNRNWSYGFKILDAAHMRLEVSEADGSSPVVVSSGFTIAAPGINNDLGGTVAYPVAPVAALTAGKIVRPFRVVPLTQPNTIGNQGGFFPKTHEDTFDLLEMQIQQAASDASRAYKAPRSEVGGLVEFGNNTQLLGFDTASGNLVPKDIVAPNAVVTPFQLGMLANADNADELLALSGGGAAGIDLFKKPTLTGIRDTLGMDERLDTIAALRAYTKVPPAGIIHLNGYQAAGDDYAGSYRRLATSTLLDDNWEIIVDAAGRRWQRIEDVADVEAWAPWPAPKNGHIRSPVPFPPSTFGKSWPHDAVDPGNEFYIFNFPTTHSIGFKRDLYGAAMFHHRRESDLWQAINNNGAPGSGFEQTEGGASWQWVFFGKTPWLYFQGYESSDNNELPSGGYQNRALNPACVGRRANHIMRIPFPRALDIVVRPMCWFGRQYGDDRNQAVAAGAKNESQANSYVHNRIVMDNIGSRETPNLIPGVIVQNVAYKRDAETELGGFDTIASFHKTSEVPEIWEIDPRPAVPLVTRTYPTRADGLAITAIALTNKNLAGDLDIGDTITTPGGVVITLADGNTVLLQNQTVPAERKVYTITAGGPVVLAVQPLQITAVGWGIYTYTAVDTWTRTFNYTSLPPMFRNAAGDKAYGYYNPLTPMRGEGSNTTDGIGCGIYTFQQYVDSYDMNGIEVQQLKSRNAVSYQMGRIPRLYKAASVIGTAAEVVSKVKLIWDFWGKVLDPLVFDWVYWRDTNPHLANEPEDQIRLDWLCRGSNTGELGKAGQTIAGKPANMSFFDWWRSLVV